MRLNHHPHHSNHRVSQVLAASAIGAVVALGVAGAAAAAPDCAGACAATNPGNLGARGNPATARPTELVFGAASGQHLVTGADEEVRVRFADRSSLTLGPNSDIVVDAFAVDPNTGAGTLRLRAAHGVLRYASGKAAPGAVTIETGAGTVSDHGGVFLLALAPSGRLDVVSLDRDGPTVTGRSGMPQTPAHAVSLVTVAAPGAAASSPLPLSADSWARFVAEAAAETAPHSAVAAIR